MTRRVTIIGLGLVLMLGLYFYDRDNSTRTILAATVLSVEDRDLDVGPDTWHVIVDLDGQQIELEPLAKRPDLGAGDRLCVARISRSGQPDEVRRANDGDSC